MNEWPLRFRLLPRIFVLIAAGELLASSQLSDSLWSLLFANLVLLALAAWIVRRIESELTQPLMEIKAGAERFASGDLSFRLYTGGSDELRGLSRALNRVAAQLQERYQIAVNQKNELEAILPCMREGLLVVSLDERIARINQAASEMIGVDSKEARGRTIQEVARNTGLQQFVRNALEGRQVQEGTIQLLGEREMHIKAYAAPIPDEVSGCSSVLVVLNDITRLEQLEKIRKDFVANVSHELKTPITSIKGFVETLLDGAVDDPAEARRFLEIVGRQAERLNGIIEDLLTLSRIERESETSGFELSPSPLLPVLQSAIETCAFRAAEKRIQIKLNCAEAIVVNVNTSLFEQAVANLIDNAIKYSPEGSEIELNAFKTPEKVVLSVKDSGPGIEKQHLPRLFERFYRVDKARSRKVGGTGLGLAIVKHITQAHGGTVSVKSSVGHGSTFTMILPANQTADNVEPG